MDGAIPTQLSVEWLESRCIPEPNTGCWLWLGTTDNDGYGVVHCKVDGRPTTRGAHRLMRALTHGSIPRGHVVMHLCDMPSCVNPAHLTTGTPARNSADMVDKGRQAKGAQHPKARLSSHHVEVIRKMATWRVLPQSVIASLFGVCTATVHHIHKRRNWRVG